MFEKDRLNLLSIIEAIDKINKYTLNLTTVDEFYNDEIAFDASMMNFIVIGEMASKLSEDCKKENNHIDWTKIKAFRNIVAHNYFGIDAEEVWQIIKTKLPELREQIKKIVNL